MQEAKKDFKVGQKWKTRVGDIIEIYSVDDAEQYPVTDTDGFTWSLDGSYMIGTEGALDLVELIEDVSSEDKQDNKYSVEEVIKALRTIVGDSYYMYISEIEEHLSKTKDPEYQKYLELKAKFE